MNSLPENRPFSIKKNFIALLMIALLIFVVVLIGGLMQWIPVDTRTIPPKFGSVATCIAMALFFAALAMAAIGWAGIVINFILMVSSKKKEVDIDDVKERRISVFSFTYLTAYGVVARERLFFFIKLFFGAICIGAVFPMLIDVAFST